MECLLLLEFYLNKHWLTGPQSRLITALPNPQFAVRCATLSAGGDINTTPTQHITFLKIHINIPLFFFS